jgi:multidrug efflux pump subunit AcrA (membrane-fusion protein)
VAVLLQVLHSGQARILLAGAKELPSLDQVLLLAPLYQQHDCVGVLEVFLPAQTPYDELTQRLDALNELSRDAARYLGRRSTTQPRGADDFHLRLIGFIEQLHRDLQVSRVAMAAVNEGRLLLGCERVSLAAVQRKKIEVLAMSGQDRVRQKSGLVRAIAELSSLVVASGRAVHHGPELEGLAPQAEEGLLQYLAESGAIRLSAIPLFAPPGAPGGDVDSFETDDPIGVLLAEWLADAPPQVSTDRAEAVAAHTAQALHNAMLHEGEFLSPLWRLLSKRLSRAERATRKQRALYAACACIGLVLLLIMPVPYYVHAQGELVPVVHLGVFAPEEGEVVEVFARGGDRIEKGQVLVRLHNDRLASERLETRNRLTETEQLLAALSAQRGTAVEKGAQEAAIRLEGRIAQTETELRGFRRRLASLEREVARLEVRSLVSGTVATFQPAQQLLNRPVQRGELLLEVMDERGPWQLELSIPAQRISHVLRARNAQERGRLPVRFTLATLPEQSFDGFVHRLGTRVDNAQGGKTALAAHAAVDAAKIPVRTCGAEVSARIYCGRESLAYWLFGDAVDFMRRFLW